MKPRVALWVLLAMPIVSACPQESAPGGSVETDDTSSTGNSSSEGSSTTQDGATTAADPSTSSSGVAGDSSSEGSSSGGADPCSDCVVTECTEQTEACALDDACGCWLDCIDTADDPSRCTARCGDLPATLEDVLACVEFQWADACGLEGGTTGEVFPSQSYEPCESDDDCDFDLSCNTIVGYCTPYCFEDEDCPAPLDGNGSPGCAPAFKNTCLLSCANGLTCPVGYSCDQLGGGSPVCVAP